MADRLNAAEAVYGFVAWLSTRKSTTFIGSDHECSNLVKLIEEFNDANNFDKVRQNYHVYLKHPPKE